MSYTVYKHTCPNGKVYIGITGRNPKKRWERGNKYKANRYFYNAILKYGWDNIRHSILLTGSTKEQAEQKEIELIYLHKSANKAYGYNIALGGNANQLGRLRSEEEKARISQSCLTSAAFLDGSLRSAETRKGRSLSDETKTKISIANKGNNFGQKRSIEIRNKISATLKGRKFSEEHRKALSEAAKKRYVKETKQNAIR